MNTNHDYIVDETEVLGCLSRRSLITLPKRLDIRLGMVISEKRLRHADFNLQLQGSSFFPDLGHGGSITSE